MQWLSGIYAIGRQWAVASHDVSKTKHTGIHGDLCPSVKGSQKMGRTITT